MFSTGQVGCYPTVALMVVLHPWKLIFNRKYIDSFRVDYPLPCWFPTRGCIFHGVSSTMRPTRTGKNRVMEWSPLESGAWLYPNMCPHSAFLPVANHVNISPNLLPPIKKMSALWRLAGMFNQPLWGCDFEGYKVRCWQLVTDRDWRFDFFNCTYWQVYLIITLRKGIYYLGSNL